MTIEVIGAGFGRTGTGSLRDALEILGYNKTYHMEDVMDSPDDEKFWLRKAKGEEVDFDKLFKGQYKAIVDFPGCLHYKELMEKYPEAKVILTLRDFDKWHASCMKTIRPACGTPYSPLGTKAAIALTPKLRHINEFTNIFLWENKDIFDGKFEDKEYCKKIYLERIEEVKKTVPAERLLVFDVTEKGDPWERLCPFLGKPIPSEAFPHAPSTGQDIFETKLRQLDTLGWVSMIGFPISLPIYGIANMIDYLKPDSFS